MWIQRNIIDKIYDFAPRRLIYSHLSKSYTQDVLATINLDAFLELRNNGRDRSATLNNIKYFNIEPYLRQNVQRAMELDLHVNWKKDVFDIGTGFGYFPYVVDFFGGAAKAIDVPGHDLFDDVTSFLRVDKTHHFVMPKEALPDFGTKFDLITGFQVSFHNIKGGTRWRAPEWEFFLKDLFDNQLKPNGQIYFELNYDDQVDDWCPRDVRALFQRYGSIRGRRVYITKP